MCFDQVEQSANSRNRTSLVGFPFPNEGTVTTKSSRKWVMTTVKRRLKRPWIATPSLGTGYVPLSRRTKSPYPGDFGCARLRQLARLSSDSWQQRGAVAISDGWRSTALVLVAAGVPWAECVMDNSEGRTAISDDRICVASRGLDFATLCVRSTAPAC